MQIRRFPGGMLTTRGSFAAVELDIHLPRGWRLTLWLARRDARAAIELWNGEIDMGHSHTLRILKTA